MSKRTDNALTEKKLIALDKKIRTFGHNRPPDSVAGATFRGHALSGRGGGCTAISEHIVGISVVL